MYIGSSEELHKGKLFATPSLPLKESYLQTVNSLVCTVIIPVDTMFTISVSVDTNFEPQSTLLWFSLPQSNSTKSYLLMSTSLPEELHYKN